MGIKFKNLKELLNKRINVHSFECIDDLENLIRYSNENEKFSMRFDRDKDYHQLPFYTYDKSLFSTIDDSNEYLNKIMNEAHKLNCSILCAIGYLYNDLQICNFVIKVEENGNFILEFCTKKVSLREMYEHETTILKGNIKDSIKDMDWIRKNANDIDERKLEKIISWALKTNIINKNIEATLYEEKVGIFNEDIACWQID